MMTIGTEWATERGRMIDEVLTPSWFPFKAEVDQLVRVRSDRLAGNMRKSRYYDGKNRLKDLGISIPPELKSVEVVVNWPAKAVDALADRSQLEGFSARDPTVSAILDEVSDSCSLDMLYSMGVRSELVHGCGFATVSRGIGDEPPVVVSLHDAEVASAVWDWRHNRIARGMTFNDFDDDGFVIDANYYDSQSVWHLWRKGRGATWGAEEMRHQMGMPPMVALVNQPSAARPFGRSRIDRAVRSTTDSAVRELLRAEVSAEFVTSPQKYLLGVDPEVAYETTPKWEAYIGNIMTIDRDPEGNLPKFGQLPQGTMQPHIDYMRMLACHFSGITDIPVSMLGVVHDNPASAEAIYAASEPLIIAAQQLNRSNGRALRDLGRMAVASWLDMPLDSVREAVRDVSVTFRNPAMPSVVSMADAMVKVASVVPGFADTDVFWEGMGFSKADVSRIRSQGGTAALARMAFEGNNGN